MGEKLTEEKVFAAYRSAGPPLLIGEYALALLGEAESLREQVKELVAQLSEILEYEGGADHALEDEYVVGRAYALLEARR